MDKKIAVKSSNTMSDTYNCSFEVRGIDGHVLHGKAGVQDLDTSNFPLTVCTIFSPLFSDFRQLTPVLTYYFYPITPPKKS